MSLSVSRRVIVPRDCDTRENISRRQRQRLDIPNVRHHSFKPRLPSLDFQTIRQRNRVGQLAAGARGLQFQPRHAEIIHDANQQRDRAAGRHFGQSGRFQNSNARLRIRRRPDRIASGAAVAKPQLVPQLGAKLHVAANLEARRQPGRIFRIHDQRNQLTGAEAQSHASAAVEWNRFAGAKGDPCESAHRGRNGTVSQIVHAHDTLRRIGRRLDSRQRLDHLRTANHTNPKGTVARGVIPGLKPVLQVARDHIDGGAEHALRVSMQGQRRRLPERFALPALLQVHDAA